MWFKEFLINIVSAFLDGLGMAFTGISDFNGSIIYYFIGVPLSICFLVGVYQIIQIIRKIIYNYQSKMKWGK